MKDMSTPEMDRILDNEKEWRKHILTEVHTLRRQVGQLNDTALTLKVKIGAFGVVFGLLGGVIFKVLELYLRSPTP